MNYRIEDLKDKVVVVAEELKILEFNIKKFWTKGCKE